MVFCEGERTEPEYLEALKRVPAIRHAAAVDLRIETGHRGAVPSTLVKLAIAAKRQAEKSGGEIDEVWCVFDVEAPQPHPGLAAAVARAQAEGIHLAISNPCFELWLVLHFQNHSAWLNNDDARRLRRSLDGQKDKGLPSVEYMSRRERASTRARLLSKKHESDGTTHPEDNPSSSVYLLIESVEGGSVQRPETQALGRRKPASAVQGSEAVRPDSHR